MHSPAADDLRALRERAYGPNADIDEDADALQRLRQLEVGEQTATPPVVGDEAEPMAVDSSDADQVQPGAPEDEPSTEAPQTGPRSRIPLLWAASILAAIFGTAFISAAVNQGVQSDPQHVGATQVTRLSVDPSFEIPASFAGDGTTDSIAFTAFHGLRVLVTSAGNGEGEYNDECILVMEAEDLVSSTEDSFEGRVFSGCAANAFPATVAVKVTGDMPVDLRKSFTEGIALQFVFDEDGSDVVVFSSVN